MKRLRNMQAMADENYLISYTTSTAIKKGRWCIIRDYPTITSKKHLRAWLDDYFGRANVKGEAFGCYWNFRDSAECAIYTARRCRNEYIILHQDDDGMWNYSTYPDRKSMCTDFEYRKALQEITPTI